MKLTRISILALVAGCFGGVLLTPAISPMVRQGVAFAATEADSKAAEGGADAKHGDAAGKTVASIRVDGFRRVEQGAIRLHVSQAVGRPLSDASVDADVKAIYGMGFFDNVWATTEVVPTGVVLVYHVAERPYVTKVEFKGNDSVDKEDLEAVVAVRARTVLDPQKAWQGVREARKVYAGEGYPDADIKYELIPDKDKPDEVTVRYFIKENARVLVKDIHFRGNKSFGDWRLRQVMSTREKWFMSFITGAGVLKEEELQTDVERMQAFYYDSGYIQVRVDEIEVVRKGDDLDLTVRIEEGEQYRVGRIFFEGEVIEETDTLVVATGMTTGQVFKPSQLRDAIFGVTEAYGNLGRAFAEAVPLTDVHPEAKTVDVGFNLTAGPVVTVDRIEIRGNTKTRDEVIRRELRQQENEQFSGKGLRQGTTRIRRLGIFDEVKVESARTDKADQVNLVVDVREGRTGTFSAGAGFSSADSLLANARIVERNLFGRGQTASLSVDFGSRSQNFRLGFTEPWAFDLPLLVGTDLFNWSYRFSDFSRGGTGGSIRVSYPLWELGLRKAFGASLDDIRVGLEYRIENTVIDGISRTAPSAIKLEEGTFLTSSLRPTISRNTIDAPFDPTEGSLNTLSVEFAGLGGDNNFTKFDLTSRWYWPFFTAESGWKLVYSTAATIGYGYGNRGPSGEELPLSERYFPGGINTVRGFQPRTLGPRQDFLDPVDFTIRSSEIGGSSQMIFNNEIIFPLIPDAGVKGDVFVDAGNAWLQDGGIKLSDMRVAAGVGLRWLSPFGPLRIEIGIPINSENTDEESLVLFSFGAPF